MKPAVDSNYQRLDPDGPQTWNNSCMVHCLHSCIFCWVEWFAFLDRIEQSANDQVACCSKRPLGGKPVLPRPMSCSEVVHHRETVALQKTKFLEPEYFSPSPSSHKRHHQAATLVIYSARLRPLPGYRSPFFDIMYCANGLYHFRV